MSQPVRRNPQIHGSSFVARAKARLRADIRRGTSRLLLAFARRHAGRVGLPTSGPPPDFLPKSILVVRLDELGDVVMGSAFLSGLHEAYPSARITVVVKAACADAVAACPFVDKVVAYQPPNGQPWHLSHVTSPLKLGAELRQDGPFDLAINPRWDKDTYYTSVIAVLAGATYRVAFSESVYSDKAREFVGFDALSTLTVMCESQRHEVEKALTLLRSLPNVHARETEPLAYWSQREAEREARETLAALGIVGRFIALCVSSGRSPLKGWPLDRFDDLIRQLREEYGVPVVLVGSGDDTEKSLAVVRSVSDTHVVTLAGELSLGATAEVIRSADLFVGCDSGLSHIAAAVGTPQVTLFGSSCAHRFRPWSPVARTVVAELPCGPCAPPHTQDRCVVCIYDSPRCMESLTVHDVVTEIRLALSPTV